MTDTISTTRAAVKTMTKSGVKPRWIAGALGISTQRVYQHLTALDMKPAK